MRRLPLILLILLCAGLFIIVFVQANDYGITMDEPLQDVYGLSTLHWYTSLGKDTSFLDYQPGLYMPEHGAIFDTLVATLQQSGGNHWYIRAVITALSGVVGIVFLALCGYEIGGWWLALVAATGLTLYPRYEGAMWNNPKDIPFAAAMAVVLWSVLLLMRHWQSKHCIWYCALVGVCFGFAASIRVVAVMWIPTLLLLVGGSWITSGVSIRHMWAALMIGATAMLSMILCWPYIALNPFAHLYESIMVMSRYPWPGSVLFDGHMYKATNSPYDYVPMWLVIGSPPALIACGLLGIAVIALCAARKHVVNAKVLLIVLSFVVPLVALIAMHSVLYNSLRQFLFLVPPLMLIASYGVVETVRSLWKHRMRGIAIGAIGVLALNYLFTVADMAQLYPYQYVYFSPIVGGVNGANGRYEMDYWNSCDKESAQWLAQHYQNYLHATHPTVHGIRYFEQLIQVYLPQDWIISEQHPDFLIASAWEPEPTGYHVIHLVSRKGVAFCSISAKQGSSISLAFVALFPSVSP